jgi:predicted NBD/HSP70 family sugar kinase
MGAQPKALGIATAGSMNTETGAVAYVADNIPGCTGAPIGEELNQATGLPVAVENDANAAAIAEKRFGAAKDVKSFICMTLGTGMGGGCYIDGKLNRGNHYFADAVGHLAIHPKGLACTCGRRGCL